MFRNDPITCDPICRRKASGFVDLLRRHGSRRPNVGVSRIVRLGDKELIERYVWDEVGPFELVA